MLTWQQFVSTQDFFNGMSSRIPPLGKIALAIDALNEWVGRLNAWLIFGMMLLIAHNVAQRYLFNQSWVGLQELEWHLFAVTFMLGAAYTLKHDQHVRVDILYQSHWMTPVRRAWVNLLGSLLFLMPFCLIILYSSWAFVSNAYVQGEGSPDPGGLPQRWILKSMLLWGFGLLFLQGLSQAIQEALFLLGKMPPPAEDQQSGLREEDIF